ncbi:MAG: shikimate dehydrogenase, partial [Nitriliruptoraceae bacterium]
MLLGWPARHSASPRLHNAAFRAAGLDLVYLAAPTPPEALATVVAALGAIGAVGANVTVPHKQVVVDLCDEVSEEAVLIGAVNTLVWEEQGLTGENTDARGLADDLARTVAPAPGERWLLLGTGGAARAAAVAIGRARGVLVVAGRRPEAAATIAALAER